MNAPAPNVLAAARASRLSEGLAEDQVAVLAGVLTLRSCAPHEVLAREGQPDDHLYALVDGSLAVVKDLGTPEETTLATLSTGDFAHELGFLDGATRYASLRATTATTVLVLTRAGLESLVDTHPRVLWDVVRAIVRTGRGAQKRMAIQAAELTNYIVKQHGRY